MADKDGNILSLSWIIFCLASHDGIASCTSCGGEAAPIYKVTFKGRYCAVALGVRMNSIRRAFHEGF